MFEKVVIETRMAECTHETPGAKRAASRRVASYSTSSDRWNENDMQSRIFTIN